MRGNKTKPPILFAPVRSGSKTLQVALSSYLSEVHGLKSINQPFDIWGSDLRGGEIVDRSKLRTVATQERVQELMKKRLSYVKKMHGRLFFKIHPTTVNRVILDHLVEDYEWIVPQRKELFSQFLSFAVAHHMNIWGPGPVPADVTPFKIERRSFEIFEFEILQFDRLLSVKKDYTLLHFEDLCRQDFSALATLFPDLNHYLNSHPASHAIMGISNKLKYVSNLEECQFWFRNSPLSILFENGDKPT